MDRSAMWSALFALAVFAGGCGEQPDTTKPLPKTLEPLPEAAKPLPKAVSRAEEPSLEVPPERLLAEAEEITCATGRDIINSIGMKLVFIPPGEFMMGAPDSESGAFSHERPQHRVRITRPFRLGATEVTQAQWERVMGTSPSHFPESGPDAPVEYIFWSSAQEFCRKLSDLAEEKKASRHYRLPTEAEWEYACRAGSAGEYCYGDDVSRLGEYAWFRENSDGKTHPVAKKSPNAWGLYDMHGNVSEMCADWYDGSTINWAGVAGPPSDYYANSPTDDPTGPSVGLSRVARGGAVWESSQSCRSARRQAVDLRSLGYYTGFRVCLVLAEEETVGDVSATPAAQDRDRPAGIQ